MSPPLLPLLETIVLKLGKRSDIIPVAGDGIGIGRCGLWSEAYSENRLLNELDGKAGIVGMLACCV